MNDLNKIMNSLNLDELVFVHSFSKKLLKDKGFVRTNNIVGEIGEKRAIDFYNKNSNLPKLQFSSETTQDVDALSRKGDRYTIKTVTHPSKTTGVFWGLRTPTELQSGLQDVPRFEFLLIVVLDEYLQLKELYEMNWENFLIKKRWQSRMNAWNITISKHVLDVCRKLL